MNRFPSKRSIFLVAVLVAGVLLAITLESRPRLVPGQSPLADVPDINTLRTQFNQDAGKARLIILVSPT